MELLLVIAALCNAVKSDSMYARDTALECQKYYVECLKKQSISPYEYNTVYAREKLVKCIEDRKI